MTRTAWWKRTEMSSPENNSPKSPGKTTRKLRSPGAARSTKGRVMSPFEEDRLKKNRRIIDHFIRRINNKNSLGVGSQSLNADGLVFFTFSKFIVVVEVPEDDAGKCFIYTMVCNVGPTDDQLAILRTAMELNYMQTATKGATLGLDGEEVNLSYTCPVAGLNFQQFQTALENFLVTAMLCNERLEAVKETSRKNSF